MRDRRIDEYARLLVERSVGVQPGWQVCIRGIPLARPLIEAVVEQVARAGAYPILQMTFESIGGPFAREAPLEVLRRTAPLQERIWREIDALISIWSPESADEGADLSEERKAASRESVAPLRNRTMAMEVPWVIAEWASPATAEGAGMTVDELQEFIFDAVLRDWDSEARRMRAIADVFDGTETVRIVGPGTDLTLSLAGRTGAVDDGHINMPGGEVFYSPIEDSARGTIEFGEFPAVYFGNEVVGARLVFAEGRVVEASAQEGEEFLLETLATDEGASRLGELGIGCNRGIQRFMKTVAFDEKIDGTIHLALGNSYTSTGGTNVSGVHWDIVKDLRTRGHMYADGRLVQENGRWLV